MRHSTRISYRTSSCNARLIHGIHLTIFSVYLPSSNYASDFFQEYTNKLADLYAQYSPYSHVLYLGDMNVQINGPRCQVKSCFRVNAMLRFLEQTNMLSINVQDLCEGPTYTFAPYSANTNRTMIDHIIVNKNVTDLFTKCVIFEDHELNTSDHVPIVTHVKLEPICFKKPNFIRIKYKWNSLSPAQITETYGSEINKLFQDIQIPRNITESKIDTYYQTIISILQRASSKTLPRNRFKKFLKPKWTTEVAPFHAAMRAARVMF